MGWAEDSSGLAEGEAPVLCQKLDVAGGDRTKLVECASLAPAFLAVETGLRRKDSPWVYFYRSYLHSMQTTASPLRFPSCEQSKGEGQGQAGEGQRGVDGTHGILLSYLPC